MAERIAFYRLSRKFIDQQEDIPENASEVVYYALAVGHHVGVMDCFSRIIELPLEDYQAFLKELPEGLGRSKLEGVLKWGEIEINRSHVEQLLPLLLSRSESQESWVSLIIQCLKAMMNEPAFYIMVRKVE
jgi:formate hydrogenlyase maturation protein HycH